MNILTTRFLARGVSLLAGLVLAGAAWAQMTEAEVRKVDKEAGKITLRHAEIKSLDMPPMTMAFSVRDKAVLDTFKPGDKVLFTAAKEAGRYTVLDIQLQK